MRAPATRMFVNKLGVFLAARERLVLVVLFLVLVLLLVGISVIHNLMFSDTVQNVLVPIGPDGGRYRYRFHTRVRTRGLPERYFEDREIVIYPVESSRESSPFNILFVVAFDPPFHVAGFNESGEAIAVPAKDWEISAFSKTIAEWDDDGSAFVREITSDHKLLGGPYLVPGERTIPGALWADVVDGVVWGILKAVFFWIVFWVLWRVVVHVILPRFRFGPGCCAACGYDLRGSGVGAGCPECGWGRAVHSRCG